MGGIRLAPSDILYAGLAPGFAGLYQMNIRLPLELGAKPELRIGFGDIMSPPGVWLHVSSGNH